MIDTENKTCSVKFEDGDEGHGIALNRLKYYHTLMSVNAMMLYKKVHPGNIAFNFSFDKKKVNWYVYIHLPLVTILKKSLIDECDGTDSMTLGTNKDDGEFTYTVQFTG